MNWLDILIALIITVPAFTGFRKGFVRKLLGIAGIITGFILAVNFYETAASVLAVIIKGNKIFTDVLGFLFIIAIIYGVSIWLAKFIAGINSGSGLVDKILGTALGFLQGLIAASILLFNLSIADIPAKETRDASVFYKPVSKTAPVIFDKILDLFPGLKDVYKNYLNPDKTDKNRIPENIDEKNKENKKH